MTDKKKKKWTFGEEVELDHLYSSLHWSIKELAERFNCSMEEIRRKVREMGIEQ